MESSGEHRAGRRPTAQRARTPGRSAHESEVHCLVRLGRPVGDRLPVRVRLPCRHTPSASPDHGTGRTRGRRNHGPLTAAPVDEREKLGSVQCAYCGRSGRLSLDHLVPRLVGGPDDANNLIPACRSCNSSKGAHDVMAWHVRKGRYPRRAVLRRYVKLAWRSCEQEGQLDRRLADVDDMPFDLRALAQAVTTSGIGGDDGRWPMQWD